MANDKTGAKTGGCLCGKVRYRATGDAMAMTLCQCTHCQRVTGSAIAAYAVYPRDAVTIEQGELKTYDDQGEGKIVYRSFCPDCGSPVLGVPERMPSICIVYAGTFDDTSDFNPTVCGWCASGQPWVTLPDTIEQFPESRL